MSLAWRDGMKRYWVFVGLFVLALVMFCVGVFTLNVTIGGIGVIIVFLLYLFRGLFIPTSGDYEDRERRGRL